MDWFAPQYRYDPNEKIESVYVAPGPGGCSLVRTRRVARGNNALQDDYEVGPGQPQGAVSACLILGGLETTMDEMRYLVEAIREKKFKQRRSSGEIASMGKALLERRNNEIERTPLWERRKAENAARKRRLYLPVGYRMAPTGEPGFRIREAV